MKMSKRMYFILFPLLSTTCSPTVCSATDPFDTGSYEEKTFSRSEISGLRFNTDAGSIDISSSKEDISRIQFQKTSGPGDVKFSLKGKELNIESTASPGGGCSVKYRAFVPAGIPVSIQTGSSSVNVEGVGDLDVTAGSLYLRAKNLLGFVSLQYGSGKADIRYDGLPNYPYRFDINSASGVTTFNLPPVSTVNVSASRPQLVESDFESSLGACFSFMFNSSSGKLHIKKNQ